MEHFDVIVVGAGISGIGAGYHLQRHCPDRSYAILEGRANAVNDVVAAVPTDLVVARPALDRVGAGGSVDVVVARPAVDVGALRRLVVEVEAVVPGSALDDVLLARAAAAGAEVVVAAAELDDQTLHADAALRHPVGAVAGRHPDGGEVGGAVEVRAVVRAPVGDRAEADVGATAVGEGEFGAAPGPPDGELADGRRRIDDQGLRRQLVLLGGRGRDPADGGGLRRGDGRWGRDGAEAGEGEDGCGTEAQEGLHAYTIGVVRVRDIREPP